jgi:rfaE bifunctional protein nucleotidyltransferase chain/domain
MSSVLARDKILGRRAVAALAARERRRGRHVVFTSGVFDLLHVGHVRGFEAARRHGDLLVVGVNRDRRVRELKGPGRPVVPARQRAEMVAALRSVDVVSLFGEDDPCALIRAIRPDVVCKGGEYRTAHAPERALIESLGGRFVLLRQTPRARTTLLIQRASAAKRREAARAASRRRAKPELVAARRPLGTAPSHRPQGADGAAKRREAARAASRRRAKPELVAARRPLGTAPSHRPQGADGAAKRREAARAARHSRARR